MGGTKNNQSSWMSYLGKKELAVHFVKDTLECSCPEEVFNHYQVMRGRSGYGPFVQLIMGDRLLVKIIEMPKQSLINEAVPEILQNGVEERERRHLNRFRLVIVGHPSPVLQKTIMEFTDKMDSRVHVHIITPNEVEF
jgi:hypothetical protein